jgi:3-hydroxy-9,10-secoandrosta-1,3,5(10)-triene-9,17-dione monooxygenase
MTTLTLGDTFGDVDGELVARASALRPLVAEHADRTESGRQVAPEVMDALEAAGLFEVIVPKRMGGLGATMATQLAVAAELGRACASTAWVQTLLNVTTWAASRSPSASELFATGARPRVCGVLAPLGTATPTDGGYRVGGKWPFASGSFHSTWFLGGVLLVDDAGEVSGAGMVAVPRSDFTIDDTWFVAGMCGTASNTVVVDDVFVPASRFTPLQEAGIEPGGDPADAADLWPLGPVLALILIGPLLGAAQTCADLVTEKAPKRALSYTTYSATTESMVALTEVARARLDIDSACLHAFQAAAYIDAVGAGAPRDALDEARLRGQCGYLASLLRQGVDTLLDVAGAGSFASANVLQRHWRDLNVGSRHAFLATNVALETYGRALFGLDPVFVLV